MVQRVSQNRAAEPGRIRVWIAAFLALFLAISGVAHAAGHALQPLHASTMEVSVTSDDTAEHSHNTANAETSHCLGCAVASIPHISSTPVRTVVAEILTARPLYQAELQRRHADPPPPRVLT